MAWAQDSRGQECSLQEAPLLEPLQEARLLELQEAPMLEPPHEALLLEPPPLLEVLLGGRAGACGMPARREGQEPLKAEAALTAEAAEAVGSAASGPQATSNFRIGSSAPGRLQAADA